MYRAGTRRVPETPTIYEDYYMSFVRTMRDNAKKLGKHLVLPEGCEERTIQAAAQIYKEGIAAQVSLLGNPGAVHQRARELAVSLEGIDIIDPGVDERRQSYGKLYYELRRHKGMTGEQAFADMDHPLRWACMMLHVADADAVVAGAENATADVLRAAFTIVKTKPGIQSVSSCFLMIMDDASWGSGGRLIFSDCAILPRPSEEQLAGIALAAAESCRLFLETEPIVAMLSFSTKGSAETEDSMRVLKATRRVQESHPQLLIDGEMQLDAAIVPSVGEKKAPGSPVAGRANTLIFPDLQAGNIGYKLVQRLAGAQAIGPILQGLAKPVSDLSRGCSVEDIVNTAALTIIQCESGESE